MKKALYSSPSRWLAKTASALVVLMLVGCDSTDYAGFMRERLQSVLGTSPLWAGTSYTWFSYPTNNFGVATTFLLTDKEPTPNENTQRCATYSCLGIAPSADPVTARTVGGFVDVGSGGTIKLTEKETKSLSASAVLPKVYEILKVDIGAGVESTVTTDLTLGPAYIRVLDKLKYETMLSQLPNADPRGQAFASGGLAVVVADVMLESMSVTIAVDTKKNLTLGAALDGAVNKIVGDGAKLQVSVSKNVDGSYTLVSKDPVIVAALVKKQSAGGRLSAAMATTDLAQWGGATANTVPLKSMWAVK